MIRREPYAVLLLVTLVGFGTSPAAADRATVADRVRAELATMLKKDAATLPTDRPVRELGADELTVVEWTMALDAAFDADIPQEAITKRGSGAVRDDLTIAKMTTVVQEALAKRRRGP